MVTTRRKTDIKRKERLLLRACRQLLMAVKQRRDYMADPMRAENITAGVNDDGECGFIRDEGGLTLWWYPTLDKAIDAAILYERTKGEA